MSISNDIHTNLPVDKVDSVRVNKDYEIHGEKAIQAVVTLLDGRTVEGIFTTEARPGFGGVQFSSQKDVVALMTAKVFSVLNGTAE